MGLRICSFIEARRWFKSSVTRGFTYSVGTVGLATSRAVWEMYFFGSCVATDAPSAAQPTAQRGMNHQCLRRTLLTSATVNSPLRTMHVPFCKDSSIPWPNRTPRATQFRSEPPSSHGIKVRATRLPGRSELARVRLIADLKIPAVRVAKVKALEPAVHVGPRVQTAFFEFGLHFGSVPGLDTPRDVVDQTRYSRPIRAPCCARVFGAISDDDAAHIADLHRALLLAVVVNDLPPHQVAIESGASPVVGDTVGDVIEPHRLPRRWGPRWRDAGLFRRLLRRHECSRSGRHGKSKRLDQLPARQLPRFKIMQQSADDLLHRTLLGAASPTNAANHTLCFAVWRPSGKNRDCCTNKPVQSTLRH